MMLVVAVASRRITVVSEIFLGRSLGRALYPLAAWHGRR